jgi:hypothetical protein
MIESSYYHIDTDSINVNIYQSKFNFNRCYIDMKISADWINNSISYIISYTNGFYESSTFYDEDVSDEIYDFNDDFHYDPNDKEDASNHYLCEIFKMQQDCGKFYAIT